MNPWFKLLSKKRFSEENQEIEKEIDLRSEYQKDIDRIVFNTSFRRLQNKTQVFPLPQNDFVHTRLTHSLEVSMVGRALGLLAGQIILEKNEELNGSRDDLEIIKERRKDITTYTEQDIADIVVAACLAHDLGNPPFGHSGEKAIAYYFSTKGGEYIKNLTAAERNDFLYFEGNAAGLRLLIKSDKTKEDGGFRLSYATLGTFLKYPTNSIKKEIGNSSLNQLGNSLNDRKSLKKFNYFQSERHDFEKICDECGLVQISNIDDFGNSFARHPLTFIMEAADTICYKLIDLEDGHKVELIDTKTVSDILSNIISGNKTKDNLTRLDKIKQIEDEDFKVSELRARALIILINECSEIFKVKYDEIMKGTFDTELTELIPSEVFLRDIEDLCKRKLYCQSKILEVEIAGFEVMGNLLNFFIESIFDPNTNRAKKCLLLLPTQFGIENEENPSDYAKIMGIVDYICRMTDNYAMGLYKRINGIELPSY